MFGYFSKIKWKYFLLIFALWQMTWIRVKSGSKQKTKSSVIAAAHMDSPLHPNTGYDVHMGQSGVTEQHFHPCTNKTTLKCLKGHLFKGYDSALPPISNKTGNIHVSVGFTFRQIVDLDEKNQILKSLVWYIMKWKDESLTWNPENFEGIDSIDLPHNSVWKPQVVVYEEIGVHDYKPRLHTIKVHYNGEVEYREPCLFETTCRIDTAFFPFDVQICHLTLVSWTRPVTSIDLTSDRNSEKLSKDSKAYYVNTGEWKLVAISVKKVVKDYKNLFQNESDFSNAEKKFAMNTEKTPLNSSNSTQGTPRPEQILYFEREFSDSYQHEYHMDPLAITSEESLKTASISRTMFAEIKFTIVVKRNSSLYMQSMLFPSILLTSVAILGFYLPPDSGERIGLQITILLTFMVFLLAVGEMFPSSTGPYLGIYFVLCMGLLGINLLMTVIVLNLHFKPIVIDPDNHKHPANFFLYTSREQNTSAIPQSLRKFLQFCNRYWSLGETNVKWLQNDSVKEDLICNKLDYLTDDSLNADGDDSIKSSLGNINIIAGSPCHSERNNENELDNPYLSVPAHRATQLRSVDELSLPIINIENVVQPADPCNTIKREIYGSLTSVDSEIEDNLSASPKAKNLCKKQNPSKDSKELRGEADKSLSEDETLPRGLSPFSDNNRKNNKLRSRVVGILYDIKGYIKKSELRRKKLKKSVANKKKELEKMKKKRAQEREEMEQEEWKSVARAIDTICFRVYVLLIIISHVGLFTAALSSWFDDYNEYIKENIN